MWEKVRTRTALLHKVPAHATERDGRTTWWQKRGNDAADHYAKLGARSHGVSERQSQQVHAMRKLGRQAGRWAGTQEAHNSRTGFRDALDLVPQPRAEIGLTLIRGKPKAPAYMIEQEISLLSLPQESNLFGHTLRVAVAPEGGLLLCCTSCGAYAWKKVRSLTVACKGRGAGSGLIAQRKRLAQGLFPAVTAGNTPIGRLTTPTRRAVLWLAHMVMAKERLEAPLSYLGGVASVSTLDREATLAAYGLSEDRMEALRQEAQVEPEPAPFLSVED